MTSDMQAKQFLGATSRWTAAARAHESQRPDRLFDDPYAAALAGPEGAEWLAQRDPGFFNAIIIRTRFFDDYLQRVADQDGLRQFVLMAAGLDARAFRLAWPPGTRLFELDQAAVLAYKDEVLRSLGAQMNCERIAIGKDLREAWPEALIAGGFDPQQPACWLLEGFLFYLPSEIIRGLLERISGLASPGSRLGCDVINELVLTSPYTKAWIEMQAASGAPWIGALDDPEAFLGPRGWKVTLSAAGQPEANYGRWTLPIYPVRMANMPHNWLVTAEKR